MSAHDRDSRAAAGSGMPMRKRAVLLIRVGIDVVMGPNVKWRAQCSCLPACLLKSRRTAAQENERRKGRKCRKVPRVASGPAPRDGPPARWAPPSRLRWSRRRPCPTCCRPRRTGPPPAAARRPTGERRCRSCRRGAAARTTMRMHWLGFQGSSSAVLRGNRLATGTMAPVARAARRGSRRFADTRRSLNIVEVSRSTGALANPPQFPYQFGVRLPLIPLLQMGSAPRRIS